MLARKYADLGEPDSAFQMGIFEISYSLELNGELLFAYASKTDGEPSGLWTTGPDAYAKVSATIGEAPSADYWVFNLELSKFFWDRDGYLNLSWNLSQALNPSLSRAFGFAKVNCNQEGTERQLQISTNYVGYASGSTSSTSPYYAVITSSTVSVNDGTPTSINSAEESAKTFTPDDEITPAADPTGEAQTLGTLNSVEFVQDFADNRTNWPDSVTTGRFTLRIEYVNPLVTQWKTCYTDASKAADTASGYVTGTCRRMLSGGFPDCQITRECECQENRFMDYQAFIPGGDLCNCCCYPSKTNITAIEGLATVNNSTHVFGPTSRFSGLPAKVFVTDASDSYFSEGGKRVVAIPAEFRFPFERIEAYVTIAKRGSFSYWEYNPIPCGEAYAWAYWSGIQCSVDNAISIGLGQHLYWGTDSDCSIPVYRSVPFETTGLAQDQLNDWVANETSKALKADCTAPGWNWNLWVQTVEIAQDKLVYPEYQIAWTTRSYPNPDAATAAANYPRWELDIITDGGAEKLSGRYTQTVTYNENVCKILRTKSFGTGEGFSVPIVSDDCWPDENPLP